MKDADAVAGWNQEYGTKGIPSSLRDDPSGVLRWALANYSFVAPGRKIDRALDAGTGTGRNAVYLFEATSANVSAVDFSPVAISLAKERDVTGKIEFRVADLTAGLDFPSKTFDFIADIFVYFHILADEAREKYRKELHRVCSPGGIILVSMATADDGYYAKCPTSTACALRCPSNGIVRRRSQIFCQRRMTWCGNSRTSSPCRCGGRRTRWEACTAAITCARPSLCFCLRVSSGLVVRL